jgi:hypothetical protein
LSFVASVAMTAAVRSNSCGTVPLRDNARNHADPSADFSHYVSRTAGGTSSGRARRSTE